MITSDPVDVFYNLLFGTLPVTCTQVCRETSKDPILSHVQGLLMTGTLKSIDNPEFVAYTNCRNELSVHQECVLWGNHVVIP